MFPLRVSLLHVGRDLLARISTRNALLDWCGYLPTDHPFVWQAHRGNYQELWRKLEKKYGRKPPKPEVLKARKGEL